MSDVQMTHSEDCWQWHHECAKRAVEELAIDKERFRAENERLLGRIDALCAESVNHWSEAERLGAALGAARSLAELQAEDDGLWCPAVTATEAYLQQELRRLHAAVEGER